MRLHRFEKSILDCVLEYEEVGAHWGEMIKGLVEGNVMSQGSFSKYRRNLAARGLLAKKLNDEGEVVYYVPPEQRESVRNLVAAPAPKEQRAELLKFKDYIVGRLDEFNKAEKRIGSMEKWLREEIKLYREGGISAAYFDDISKQEMIELIEDLQEERELEREQKAKRKQASS